MFSLVKIILSTVSHQFLCSWDEIDEFVAGLTWPVGQCYFTNQWGQDAMKGSRNFFEIYNSCIRGSVVCTCYRSCERQLKTTFFEVEIDQTTESHQKYFFEAKIWIEVSKVSKQLQA